MGLFLRILLSGLILAIPAVGPVAKAANVVLILAEDLGYGDFGAFAARLIDTPDIPLAASPEFAGSSRACTYGDVVQELDWSVGELLDAVERNGIAENTVILFTSDNGPFPEGSTGGLRGGKATAWEGGFRVPFVAR